MASIEEKLPGLPDEMYAKSPPSLENLGFSHAGVYSLLDLSEIKALEGILGAFLQDVEMMQSDEVTNGFYTRIRRLVFQILEFYKGLDDFLSMQEGVSLEAKQLAFQAMIESGRYVSLEEFRAFLNNVADDITSSFGASNPGEIIWLPAPFAIRSRSPWFFEEHVIFSIQKTYNDKIPVSSNIPDNRIAGVFRIGDRVIFVDDASYSGLQLDRFIYYYQGMENNIDNLYVYLCAISLSALQFIFEGVGGFEGFNINSIRRGKGGDKFFNIHINWDGKQTTIHVSHIIDNVGAIVCGAEVDDAIKEQTRRLLADFFRQKSAKPVDHFEDHYLLILPHKVPDLASFQSMVSSMAFRRLRGCDIGRYPAPVVHRKYLYELVMKFAWEWKGARE